MLRLIPALGGLSRMRVVPDQTIIGLPRTGAVQPAEVPP